MNTELVLSDGTKPRTLTIPRAYRVEAVGDDWHITLGRGEHERFVRIPLLRWSLVSFNAAGVTMREIL